MERERDGLSLQRHGQKMAFPINPLLRLRDTGEWAWPNSNTYAYNFCSDSCTAISSGRHEDNTALSAGRKNGLAITYANRDTKRRVFEIEKPKIASTKHAAHSPSGFGEALDNYLGRYEQFGSLAPSLF